MVVPVCSFKELFAFARWNSNVVQRARSYFYLKANFHCNSCPHHSGRPLISKIKKENKLRTLWGKGGHLNLVSIGIMFPGRLPQDERQTFEDIIRSSTVYEEQPLVSTEEARRQSVTGKSTIQRVSGEQETLGTADKISSGIQNAADWVALKISSGAKEAGKLIKGKSAKIKEETQPAEEVHKIDPKIQIGVTYARLASDKAVKVTDHIVESLGEITTTLAGYMASSVAKGGIKVVPEFLKSEKNNPQGKSTVDGVVQVATTGLRGFETVYSSLEVAASDLGRCLADETVDVITYKYGEDAGLLAENSIYITGNLAVAAHNTSYIGVKSVAKQTAKKTGKAVVKDIQSTNIRKDS